VVCVMCCFGTVTVFTVVTEVVAGCLTTVDVVVDVSTGAGLGGAGTTFWVAGTTFRVAGSTFWVAITPSFSTGAGFGGAGTTFRVAGTTFRVAGSTFLVAITPSFFLEADATSFLTDLDVLPWAPLLRRLS